jgi:hypothetical protein
MKPTTIDKVVREMIKRCDVTKADLDNKEITEENARLGLSCLFCICQDICQAEKERKEEKSEMQTAIELIEG